ncbi:hypothetical protein MTR67_039087 [Solanum verrucosum]|uniref:Uncharacterized protein n=1 Tax=Solanum verrucosum TaxID=315347 RepID=A0AAF0UGR8_SOLVR|nr:hypothetical protein MTR67_039087 [Solanum verrucosum]
MDQMGKKLELLTRALDIVLGSEMTELGGWLSYRKYSLKNYVFTGLKRILSMLLEEELSTELRDEDATNLIRLLFASSRKTIL